MILRRAAFSGLCLFSAAISARPAFAQADIVESLGTVNVLVGDISRRVSALPSRVDPNDTVRTAAGAAAKIDFLDGTVIQMGGDASFTFTSSVQEVEGQLSVGSIRAMVKKAVGKRPFSVRTPIAVFTVRGTEFEVSVGQDRQVDLSVFEGVVGVKTLLGEEIEVGEGRPLRSLHLVPDRPIETGAIYRANLQKTQTEPSKPAKGTLGQQAIGLGLEEFKKDVEREVALGLVKDEVQAAAAVEARRAEYQEGKTLIDVFGKRVRIEEYIVRPAADQFKFVVLNERSERFDFFYYQAKFNLPLPSDLSAALKYLNGKTGAAPDFFITAFETGRSNTIDTIQENGTGGHLVNSPLTADKTVYDPGTNSFATLTAGTAFWSTLFDNYSYKINGREKYGWQPAGAANITAYDYIATGFNTRIIGAVCATLACETAARPSAITQPEGAATLHDRVTITYAADGTRETYDFFVINDDGKLATAADFNGVINGSTYKNTLLKFNYQQTITASEFGGRKIDLVVEPKILVKSGVIQ